MDGWRQASGTGMYEHVCHGYVRSEMPGIGTVYEAVVAIGDGGGGGYSAVFTSMS